MASPLTAALRSRSLSIGGSPRCAEAASTAGNTKRTADSEAGRGACCQSANKSKQWRNCIYQLMKMFIADVHLLLSSTRPFFSMLKLHQLMRQHVRPVKIEMRFYACNSQLFFQCRIIMSFLISDLSQHSVVIPLAPSRHTGWNITQKCIGKMLLVHVKS